jgi:phytol kinase
MLESTAMSRVFESDPFLVGVSFLWIFLAVGVGELARRAGNYPPDVTRKIIHVGVGMWALPTALLFRSPWWAALCPAVFMILNAVSYRFRLMDVIEEEGEGSAGTVYFPVSFVLLILILWPLDGRAASVAGLYAMGFGDAAASIFGRRFGRHRYTIGGVQKSWEGTAAMFLFSFVFILLGTWPLLNGQAWIPALGAAAVATLAEAPAGKGFDNLTVPLCAGFAFFALQRIVS